MESETKIDKKKIIKFAGAGILTGALVMGVGLHLYDANIDHLNEFCPLNNVFGLEHQVHEINNNGLSMDAVAYDDSFINITAPAEERTIYTLPPGYILGEDGKGYKYLADGTVECIKPIKTKDYVAADGYKLQGDKMYKNIINPDVSNKSR